MEPPGVDSSHHEGVARLPKVARVAAAVAFFLAGGAVWSALTQTIAALPLALITLFAGIGILRRRVWSAYGCALVAFSDMALLPLVLFRGGSLPTIVAPAVFALLIGILFVAAARALERAGAEPGIAWPWIVIAVVTTVPLFFFEPFVVPSGAMENTILAGDRIVARRIPAPAPARDEMIVFTYPIDRKQVFIKRIAGMPGDRLHISNKILYRNGVRLNEPWAIHKSDYLDSYRDNFPSEPNAPLYPPAQQMLAANVVNGEVVVPPGKYFVLGDNRDQSLDSRYWGFITRADIIGKPALIYDSIELPRGHRRWERVLKLL